jgi:hypothetical protein
VWTLLSAGRGGYVPPTNLGICGKCQREMPLTVFGWCEPCVDKAGHGLCGSCHKPMVRDGDVMRHGAGQGCNAVAPITNLVAAPSSTPQPAGAYTTPQPTDAPKPGQCGGCGSKLGHVRIGADRLPFCFLCDNQRPEQTPTSQTCSRCGETGYIVHVRPPLDGGKQAAEVRFLLHDMTGTTACPTDEQLHTAEGRRPQDRPGPNKDLQWRLSADYQRRPGESVEGWQHRASQGPPATTTPAPNAGVRTERTEGAPMTSAQQTGEVTGIPSAINYMAAVAATHTQHADSQQILTAMNGMNIGVGDISKVQAAQAASANAAELWTRAATTVQEHNAGVREGFASAPDAADKKAQQGE